MELKPLTGTSEQSTSTSLVQEPTVSFDNINDRILKVFNGRPLSAKEILDHS